MAHFIILLFTLVFLIYCFVLQFLSITYLYESICKKIGMPSPEEEIVKACAKDIQKTMYDQKTPSIMKLITRTKRTTSNYYHLTPKKKLYRTPLEVALQLYNKIPADIKHVKPKTFKKKLKKLKRDDLDFTLAA